MELENLKSNLLSKENTEEVFAGPEAMRALWHLAKDQFEPKYIDESAEWHTASMSYLIADMCHYVNDPTVDPSDDFARNFSEVLNWFFSKYGAALAHVILKDIYEMRMGVNGAIQVLWSHMQNLSMKVVKELPELADAEENVLYCVETPSIDVSYGYKYPYGIYKYQPETTYTHEHEEYVLDEEGNPMYDEEGNAIKETIVDTSTEPAKFVWVAATSIDMTDYGAEYVRIDEVGKNDVSNAGGSEDESTETAESEISEETT